MSLSDTMIAAASDWSALEVAKLAVSALTPLVVLGLGVALNRTARRVEDLQWKNQKVIERRIELYNEMAPRLNDLFCFFLRVGQFAEITPPDAIVRKRELDRTFHAHSPLFTRDFGDRYNEFINACFLAFTGAGEPAKLRMSSRTQRVERPPGTWNDEWDSLFAKEKDQTKEEAIADSYDALMGSFARELGVEPAPPRPRGWLTAPWFDHNAT